MKRIRLNERNIIIISFSLFSIILFISAFVYKEIALFINLLILGTMVLILPYTIYKFIRFQLIKNCEDNFPNFLRDVAAAKRSGLTMIQAIRSCARAQYGALTPYVVKLNNQLSWNIPLQKALENFRNALKESSIISQSILAISQIEESGGNTEDILDSLAENIEGIKEAEAEKKTLMSQHIIAMYAIFYIFLGISLALISFLLKFPEIPGAEQLEALPIGRSPCEGCINSQAGICFVCNIFFHLCKSFEFGIASSPRCYYNAMFMLMIIIQGIFSGLIAGLVGSNSIIAGVKHSLIMSISGFIVFLIVSQLGII